MRQPIIIDGQKVGRLKASWLLFEESFRFLRADKEMVLVPVLMSFANLVLLAVYLIIFFTAVFHGGIPATEEEWGKAFEGPLWYVFLLGIYVIGAFTLALSQGAIAHTVYTRLHGGNATLWEAFSKAWSRALALFLWSLLSATVGVLIRALMERSKLLAGIVALVLGVAWSVLTYFVVPAVVLDKKSVFPAIAHSGRTFKNTWGETLVSNISLGLVFFLAQLLTILAGVLLGVVAFHALPDGVAVGVIVLIVTLGVLLVFVLSLLQATLNGVLRTLLYIYASEQAKPEGFNSELFSQILVRKNPEVPSSTAV